MGLFGFVTKALGKVIKTGLGVATQGASNQIFDYIDAKKRNQAMSAAAARYLKPTPKIKGTFRFTGGLGDFAEQQRLTGETPGERQERLRRQRLANLAKARAKRRAADSPR